MTRDEAVALIERMKTIRPTCEKCETASYAWARHLMTLGMNEEDTPGEFMHARGYEESADRAGYIKRCEACASGRNFPWADDLTPEAVVAFVAKEPWRDEVAWLLDELKPVADDCKPRGGFEFL